jgi:hypothetical protein
MTMQIIYLLLVAFLFGSAAVAAARNRRAGAKGPGWLVSLLIWAGLIALIAVLYQGVQFWTTLGSIFR